MISVAAFDLVCFITPGSLINIVSQGKGMLLKGNHREHIKKVVGADSIDCHGAGAVIRLFSWDSLRQFLSRTESKYKEIDAYALLKLKPGCNPGRLESCSFQWEMRLRIDSVSLIIVKAMAMDWVIL